MHVRHQRCIVVWCDIGSHHGAGWWFGATISTTSDKKRASSGDITGCRRCRPRQAGRVAVLIDLLNDALLLVGIVESTTVDYGAGFDEREDLGVASALFHTICIGDGRAFR